MGAAEKIIVPPVEQIEKQEQPSETLRTLETKYSKLYFNESNDAVVENDDADGLAVKIKEGIKLRLEVYGEWVGDGTRWFIKRLSGASRAFWGAIWSGNVFPLRMEIVDFETGRDELKNARFAGRLTGFVVVSAMNGLVLMTLRHPKVWLSVAGLGILGFFVPEAWTALQLVLGFTTVIFFPLGIWKARTYKGLKLMVVEELDRLTNPKECSEKKS